MLGIIYISNLGISFVLLIVCLFICKMHYVEVFRNQSVDFSRRFVLYLPDIICYLGNNNSTPSTLTIIPDSCLFAS